MTAPPGNRHSQNYFAKAHSNNRLPDPVELASRLEEARTSAKLLEQVVMNTPSDEMLQNELIREFADRCLSASRSLQGYMVSENPAPDNDTMEGLIDTNEQLQTALNQHNRAVLNARKQLGLGISPGDDSPALQSDQSDTNSQLRTNGDASGLLAGGAAPDVAGGKGKQTQQYPGLASNGMGSGSNSRHSPKNEALADPFADPAEAKAAGHTPLKFEPEFPHEPFHPGFGGPLSSNTPALNGVGSSSSHNGLSKLETTVENNRDDGSSDIYAATPQGNKSRHL